MKNIINNTTTSYQVIHRGAGACGLPYSTREEALKKIEDYKREEFGDCVRFELMEMEDEAQLYNKDFDPEDPATLLAARTGAKARVESLYFIEEIKEEL